MSCRLPYRAWLVLLLSLPIAPAQAQTRGWLRYADGNAVSGVLLDGDAAGGTFRSDRFGELRFSSAEARFETDMPAPASVPASAPAVESAAPATAAPRRVWQPASWSISLSGYWQKDNGSVESDAAIDLSATWKRAQNELSVGLGTDYKIVNGAVDTNEQRGNLRWLHDLRSPWFALTLGKAKRQTFSLDPLPAQDYLLLQGSLGLGWRRQWSDESRTLVAVAHDRVTLDLLDLDVRLRTHATSLLLENTLRLLPRIRFSQTLYAYWWADGSTGVDSSAELSHDVTERISVGLLHEYRRNAVNLDLGSFNRLSVTTRVRF